jgi:paired amphipathic helix protein Sin3a
MLYSRLKTFKDIANGLSGDAAGYQPVNPLAKELGLTDPAAAILEEGPNPAAHFYHHLLDQCEKLFDGEIDTPTFEETVRFMYGIKAYPAFTLDKVVAGVIKHCQTILTRCFKRTDLRIFEASNNRSLTEWKSKRFLRLKRTCSKSIG